MDFPKILVVEDDLSFIVELELMLSEMKYERVETANNLSGARRKLKSFKPDLVICDIYLPAKADGMTLAKELMEAHIPTILITSSQDSSIYEEARGVLPLAYLVKPFAALSLQSVIERSLAGQGGRLLPELIGRMQQEQMTKAHLFVKQGASLIKLAISDIDFVEADGNYCYLFAGEKKFAVKTSLRSMKNKLQQAGFLQANRGTLINFERIKAIRFSEGVIELKDQEVAIGDKYRSEISSWARRV